MPMIVRALKFINPYVVAMEKHTQTIAMRKEPV
jgi:hypothetical protein